MYFRRRTEIHVDVINARKWFDGINIPTAGTRLEEIHKYFDELLNPTAPEANPLEAHPIEDSYYALNDGAGFGLIAGEMSKLPPHRLPRRTLQDILKGPLAASQENTTVSDSRNKFVELELAAYLSSAGFKLVGFDDLKFEFEGCNYLIECKRPFHERRLNDNMEKAYAQLQGKLTDSSQRGIIAIAVEKIFLTNEWSRFRDAFHSFPMNADVVLIDTGTTQILPHPASTCCKTFNRSRSFALNSIRSGPIPPPALG